MLASSQRSGSDAYATWALAVRYAPAPLSSTRTSTRSPIRPRSKSGISSPTSTSARDTTAQPGTSPRPTRAIQRARRARGIAPASVSTAPSVAADDRGRRRARNGPRRRDDAQRREREEPAPARDRGPSGRTEVEVREVLAGARDERFERDAEREAEPAADRRREHRRDQQAEGDQDERLRAHARELVRERERDDRGREGHVQHTRGDRTHHHRRGRAIAAQRSPRDVRGQQRGGDQRSDRGRQPGRRVVPAEHDQDHGHRHRARERAPDRDRAHRDRADRTVDGSRARRRSHPTSLAYRARAREPRAGTGRDPRASRLPGRSRG